jgi:hypothetical protein
MPTVTFDIVYVFFVLSLERRRVLHVNVTTHPHAAWAAQQVVQAIGADVVPVRLIRDRDAIFSTVFDARVSNLGICQLRIAPRSLNSVRAGEGRPTLGRYVRRRRALAVPRGFRRPTRLGGDAVRAECRGLDELREPERVDEADAPSLRGATAAAHLPGGLRIRDLAVLTERQRHVWRRRSGRYRRGELVDGEHLDARLPTSVAVAVAEGHQRTSVLP